MVDGQKVTALLTPAELEQWDAQQEYEQAMRESEDPEQFARDAELARLVGVNYQLSDQKLAELEAATARRNPEWPRRARPRSHARRMSWTRHSRSATSRSQRSRSCWGWFMRKYCY